MGDFENKVEKIRSKYKKEIENPLEYERMSANEYNPIDLKLSGIRKHVLSEGYKDYEEYYREKFSQILEEDRREEALNQPIAFTNIDYEALYLKSMRSRNELSDINDRMDKENDELRSKLKKRNDEIIKLEEKIDKSEGYEEKIVDLKKKISDLEDREKRRTETKLISKKLQVKSEIESTDKAQKLRPTIDMEEEIMELILLCGVSPDSIRQFLRSICSYPNNLEKVCWLIAKLTDFTEKRGDIGILRSLDKIALLLEMDENEVRLIIHDLKINKVLELQGLGRRFYSEYHVDEVTVLPMLVQTLWSE